MDVFKLGQNLLNLGTFCCLHCGSHDYFKQMTKGANDHGQAKPLYKAAAMNKGLLEEVCQQWIHWGTVDSNFRMAHTTFNELCNIIEPHVAPDVSCPWELFPARVLWLVNLGQKCFHSTFVKYFNIVTSEKPPHGSIKTFWWYLRGFLKFWCFHYHFLFLFFNFALF